MASSKANKQHLFTHRATRILFTCLMLVLQASGVHALVKDKSALYEKYP